jgi:hypothetical protein
MYCKNCGKEIVDSSTFCPSCGVNQQVSNITSNQPNLSSNIEDKFLGLSNYYIEEFKKIHESNEQYKGKFNWTAFFFGSFWSLIKGLWLSAIVSLGIGIFTGGLGFIIYWFIFGFRGNYIYYNYVVKNKQIPL